MKCATRHEATASVGDHDVPAAAAATSFNRLGTASFCVSALASSWATRASVGVPAKMLYSSPPSPYVHPVPIPVITPQCVAVLPMLQVQFDPGSIPAASTSDTSDATEGTAVGVTAATVGVLEATTVGVLAVADEVAAAGAVGATGATVSATLADTWRREAASTTAALEDHAGFLRGGRTGRVVPA